MIIKLHTVQNWNSHDKRANQRHERKILKILNEIK